MRSSILPCLLVILLGPVSAISAVPKKHAGNLYLLAVNVGTHDPNGTPDDWNYASEELERIVKAQCSGVFREVKTHLVMGTQATPQGIMKGIEWLQNNVQEQDLALYYSGSHGGSDAKRGFILYANEGNVYGDEIKPALAKIKGRVVVVIQACHSGDILVKHRKDLEAMPKNCAAVCACKAGQSSHGIMLPPIMEGLYGFADANNDGVVSVGEFLDYVDYRISTFYPEEYAKTQQAVTAEPKDFDLSTPLAKDVFSKKLARELVIAEWNNNWYGGIIIPKKDPTKKGRRLIHFFDDKAGEEEWVEKERICPHDAEPAIVKSGATWYTAALLKREGDRFHIRYISATDSKEETVGRERIEAFSLFGQDK